MVHKLKWSGKKLYEVGYLFKVWADNPKQAKKIVNTLINPDAHRDFETGDFTDIIYTGIEETGKK